MFNRSKERVKMATAIADLASEMGLILNGHTAMLDANNKPMDTRTVCEDFHKSIQKVADALVASYGDA